MELYDYHVSLRQDLIDIIGEIKDADPDLYSDNTNPNHITRQSLERIHKKYVSEAQQFGLYVVTRHCHCPNPKHENYPISNAYGLEISFRDPNYIWLGGQFYQGDRLCKCPCSNNNRTTTHHVIDDVIYEKRADKKVCKNLESILGEVAESIENAADKKPRSSIREHLLSAVITINDQILPQPVDEYIKQQKSISGR